MLKDGIFHKEKQITDRAKDPSSAQIFACLKPIKQGKMFSFEKAQNLFIYKITSTK